MKYYFYAGKLFDNDNNNKAEWVQGIVTANDEISPPDVFNGLVKDLENKFPDRTPRITAFHSVS
ncbi:MAG: hypothetical protein OER77_00240 [Myxococcales bacterium]|nr:hypothetical protein [Myxococcales bacterium]